MFLSELLFKTSVKVSQTLKAQLMTLNKTQKITLAISSLTVRLNAVINMIKQILQLMSSLSNSIMKVNKIN